MVPTFNEEFFRKATGTSLWVLLLLFPALSFFFGTTWDENHSIGYSKQIVDYFTSFGNDRSCLDTHSGMNRHLIYYGNLFGIISEILSRIIPIDILWIRHFLNSVLGFVTVLFTVKLTRLLSTERAALIALVLMVFFPRFTGLAFNDFRDTAFAAGFIASLFYLFKLAPRLWDSDRYTVAKLAWWIFFTCGIRIVGMILFAFVVIAFAANAVRLWRSGKEVKNTILRSAGFIGLLFVLVYLALVLTWPYALQSPLSNPFRALIAFGKLRLIDVLQLYFGELISSTEMPMSYLIVWIGITTPLITLAGFLSYPFLTLFGISEREKSSKMLLLLFFIIPVLVSMRPGTNHYDGWRHYLFLVPVISGCAAMGWDSLLRLLTGKPVLKYVTASLFAVLLFFPARASFVYFPNQNVYFNEVIGGIPNAFGKFEIDTYSNVIRYGVEWLNGQTDEIGSDSLIIGTNNDALAFKYFGNNALSQKEIRYLKWEMLFRDRWDYAVLTPREIPAYIIEKGFWPPDETVFNITLDGVPILSVLKKENHDLEKANAALRDNQIQEALNLMHRAVNYYKNKWEAYDMLGQTLFSIKNYREAESMLLKSLEYSGRNPNAYFFLGLIDMNEEHFEKAQENLEKCVALEKNSFDAMNYLIKVYLIQGDFRNAIRSYEDILENDFLIFRNKEDRALIMNDYAQCLLEYGSRKASEKRDYFSRAEGILLQVTRECPEFKMTYENLIALYKVQGRKSEMQKYVNLLYALSDSL